METKGKHIIVELSGCKTELLREMESIKEIMVNAAIAAKAEVRETAFHRFLPEGISGVVVIAESHLSIHTWPEAGYAAVDIYTCGNDTIPEKACSYIANKLEAETTHQMVIIRGIPDPKNKHLHSLTTESEHIRSRLIAASS